MKRVLIAVAAVVVVAVVAVIVVVKVRDGKQPPALTSSPGVYRLTPAPVNLPSIYTAVPTSGGTRYIVYGGISDGGQVAQLWVYDRQGDPHPTQVTLTAGTTKDVSGVQLRIVHIWSMPNPSHDAIDVHAVSAA
ncbi:MAG: hypothetical protein ABSA93_16945 [Streptosporangiaceae bacterium]|jgi:hypothetical protein